MTRYYKLHQINYTAIGVVTVRVSSSTDPRSVGRGADGEQYVGGADLLHDVLVPASTQAAAAKAQGRKRATAVHLRGDHGQ